MKTFYIFIVFLQILNINSADVEMKTNVETVEQDFDYCRVDPDKKIFLVSEDCFSTQCGLFQTGLQLAVQEKIEFHYVYKGRERLIVYSSTDHIYHASCVKIRRIEIPLLVEKCHSSIAAFAIKDDGNFNSYFFFLPLSNLIIIYFF